MTEKNLAAVLHGIDDIRMEEVEIPQVDDDEVLLRMSQVGICGSDVHYWKAGRIGHFILKKPMILGHESSGVVKKCGANVKHLKVGDRVAIEPGIPCRKCDLCKGGRYNLCPDIVFCATPPYDGNLCRYYKQAADFCYRLPDHVSLEEGALLEPLSVAVHACRRAGVKLGSRVLVCGAGPIGLMTFLTAKAMGATKVCISDVVDERLQVAKKLGVDATVNVKSLDPEATVKEVISKIGAAPDVTIECSGAEQSTRLGMLATATGGILVLVGMGADEVKVPLVSALVREVDIRGIFRYANCYPLALEMISSGKIDVKPLITHRFKMEESVKAFETVHGRVGNPIKVMISC